MGPDNLGWGWKLVCQNKNSIALVSVYHGVKNMGQDYKSFGPCQIKPDDPRGLFSKYK